MIVRAGRAFDQKAPLALVPLVVHCGDDVPIGVAVFNKRVEKPFGIGLAQKNDRAVTSLEIDPVERKIVGLEARVVPGDE